MKWQYCIVVEDSTRSMNYGIGKYVECLKKVLSERSDINLIIIHVTKIQDIQHNSVFGDIWISRAMFENKSSLELYLRNFLDVAVPTIIHFNGLLIEELGAIFRNMIRHSRVVCTIHFLSWYFSLMGNKTLFKEIIANKGLVDLHPKASITYKYYLENKKNIMFCDFVIVLCNETKEILVDYFEINPTKIYVIPNGLDINENFILRSPIKDKQIIYSGRIDPIKGVYYLAKAMNIVKRVYPEARLILAGDSTDEKYLNDCLYDAENIKYVGKLTSEQLHKAYSESIIGILPSFHEQCSYSAIEMMMHKLPIIGSNTTGLSEMLSNTPQNCVSIYGNTSFQTDYINNIALCIIRLLSDEEYRKKCSIDMWNTYTNQFTFDHFKIKMNTFINNIQLV